jgi:hypothetical protein
MTQPRENRVRDSGLRRLGQFLHRAPHHYCARRPHQDVLRARIRELREIHVRQGYWRIRDPAATRRPNGHRLRFP